MLHSLLDRKFVNFIYASSLAFEDVYRPDASLCLCDNRRTLRQHSRMDNVGLPGALKNKGCKYKEPSTFPLQSATSLQFKYLYICYTPQKPQNRSYRYATNQRNKNTKIKVIKQNDLIESRNFLDLQRKVRGHWK